MYVYTRGEEGWCGGTTGSVKNLTRPTSTKLGLYDEPDPEPTKMLDWVKGGKSML